MTFEELTKVNEGLKTTDIGKGKEYIEVNQRIKAFRMLYPNGTIETELLSFNEGVAVFKAVVKDDEGRTLGTGHAYEKEGSSFINKTSYIENCETSAVGRALAMCGIGIDTSVASYEEVANAKAQQQNFLITADMKAEILKEINRTMVTPAQICEMFKIKIIDDLPRTEFVKLMKKLAATPTYEGK